MNRRNLLKGALSLPVVVATVPRQQYVPSVANGAHVVLHKDGATVTYGYDIATDSLFEISRDAIYGYVRTYR